MAPAPVREIVSGSKWYPAGRTEATPRLSVLLALTPDATERSFQDTVGSLLQTRSPALELVVVHDASPGAPFDLVTRLMREDPRVSTIRHPRTVGLLALSFDEAILRARAEHFLLAFEGDRFDPEALAALLANGDQGTDIIAHGWVELEHGPERTRVEAFGREERPQAALRGADHLASQGVLLPRAAVEATGFFDPHVAMSSDFDWDLWRRLAERFRFRPVDVAVCRTENPTARHLLHRQLVDPWLAAEWMELDRALELEPGVSRTAMCSAFRIRSREREHTPSRG